MAIPVFSNSSSEKVWDLASYTGMIDGLFDSYFFGFGGDSEVGMLKQKMRGT